MGVPTNPASSPGSSGSGAAIVSAVIDLKASAPAYSPVGPGGRGVLVHAKADEDADPRVRAEAEDRAVGDVVLGAGLQRNPVKRGAVGAPAVLDEDRGGPAAGARGELEVAGGDQRRVHLPVAGGGPADV